MINAKLQCYVLYEMVQNDSVEYKADWLIDE